MAAASTPVLLRLSLLAFAAAASLAIVDPRVALVALAVTSVGALVLATIDAPRPVPMPVPVAVRERAQARTSDTRAGRDLVARSPRLRT